MKTRTLLAVVAALSASGVFARTGFAASMMTIADTPFGKFAVAVPEFAAKDFSIADFGAKEGVKATDAFAAAMAECEKSGGGRVVVPKGKWLTGAVHFRNNCNLHLAEGATLEFTDDPADYPEVFTTWEGIECYNHSPLLYAFGVTNVAITGSGTIAPRMDFWRTWFERPPEHMKATEHLYYWCSTNAPLESRRLLALDRAHMRPHLIQFNRCGNVLLDGFKIRESPFWMIHLYHSENCVVRNLDTRAKGHNNDGVDIDMTKNVLVENCRFDQGDDGIVLKAGRNADAWRIGRCTENVVVRDCDLVNCHSLLGIGSELSGGIRNVWMTRCTVEDTFSMLRIKTGPRRGGFVENVFMDHCRGRRMIRVFNILTSYAAQWGRFPDFELRRTKIRNVNISDCEAELASVGVELRGDRLMPPSGIRVRNVRVGRVVNSLSDVRNCHDVDIAGLSSLPKGEIPVDLKPRLFFAGDSTLDDQGKSLFGTSRDPYRSWGTALQEHMVAGCTVRNYAKSGESTKSFMKSGQWRTMIRDVKPGDYVAIQFGHNDQKRSSEFYLNERWADPKGLFREIVRGWVAEVRAKGATPILLSPICRGTFDKDGKRLVDTTHASTGVCLGSYRDAMKELSAELDCDYVDMNGLTRELIERVGRDEAMKFFVISTGLVFGKDGEPSKDVTHPCRAGAEAFAKLFLEDVKRRGLPIAEMFESAPAAPPAKKRLDAALEKPLGVTAQDVSTWVSVFNELEAMDAAADQAWLDLPDRAAYDIHRKSLHSKMIAAIGGLPEKTPLNARTVAVIQRSGYKIEKIVFESMPGIFVTANLFVPDDQKFKAPYPAIVMSCGHSNLGKDSDVYLRACVLAVKAGFVALMYDPYEQGERRMSPLSSTKDHCQIGFRAALLGGSMAQLRIWDAMQAVSLVMGRAEVDAKRIGFMGQSGGGTVSALMTAADLRLKATAPSCYLTSLTSLCEHMGPQDAEQNIFGQLAFGLNHTGYVLIPDAKVAVTAKFSDMFTYYGTCRLFRVVEEVAEKVGSAGQYALNAAYGVHGWTEGTEQGSIDWMRTWLRGETGLLPLDVQKCTALDVGFRLADADLGLAEGERGCTPTGCTADLAGARTIYDVFREKLAKTKAERRPFASAKERAAIVRRLAAVRLPDESGVIVKDMGEENVEGFRVRHLAFIHRNGLALPAELIVRDGAVPTEAVVSVGRAGRAAALAEARGELDAGRAVVVADLSGLGSIGKGKHVFYGATDCPEEGTSAMLYLMGESMVGRRATDILAIAEWLRGRGFADVAVVAKNDVAISAAHAFAAQPGAISSVRMVDALPSWCEMLSSENDGRENLRYTFIVNGALLYYDWTDLVGRD